MLQIDDKIKMYECGLFWKEVERLEDDEPGEIRVFGIDSCPSGYEQLNATKGAVLMSKPDGGHALDKRLLASAK